MSIQDFGQSFNLETFIRARDLAREMTYELSSRIRPGMTEEEAHNLYKEMCSKQDIKKQWHPAKIRFGKNTIKNFRDLSDPYTLQEEDIFFIDIGPVWEGHEADYGETFSVGNDFDHKHIAASSVKVFEEVRTHWMKNKINGEELYAFAKARAEHYGYKLNMGNDGHRIGDFPHHVHFKGGLPECPEEVVPNAWILEIHLISKTNRFGAFYEDILTDSELNR